MDVWNKFWGKGKLEWDKEDIASSESLQEILNLIKEYFGNNKNLTSIELGAGSGLVSYFLAINNVKTTLLDSSKEAQKKASEFWQEKKYEYVLSDLFKYRGKKFDIALSFGLCEHFAGNERARVLEEHVELLKKKGIAIISVPYKYGIFYRLSKFFAEKLGYWSFGTEIPFSKGELINFAKSEKLDYEIRMGGFYSSFYDFVIRKPLKIFKINLKRRFDNTHSIFDRALGSSIVIILKKN